MSIIFLSFCFIILNFIFLNEILFGVFRWVIQISEKYSERNSGSTICGLFTKMVNTYDHIPSI